MDRQKYKYNIIMLNLPEKDFNLIKKIKTEHGQSYCQTVRSIITAARTGQLLDKSGQNFFSKFEKDSPQ